jgi:plastocyanin
MSLRAPLAVAVVALSGLVTAACGTGTNVPVNVGAVQSANAPAPAAVVLLRYHSFEPSRLTIHAGQTVEWRFEDQTGIPGDVTFQGFASPVQQSGTWSYTFTTPGTYSYENSLRSEARGVVVVLP